MALLKEWEYSSTLKLVGDFETDHSDHLMI